MSKPKSTRARRAPTAQRSRPIHSGSQASLEAAKHAVERCRDGLKLEYYLGALCEAWDCPDEQLDALAVEALTTIHADEKFADQMWRVWKVGAHPRAMLLTSIDQEIRLHLDKPEFDGRFNRLRAAFYRKGGETWVAAARREFEDLVR